MRKAILGGMALFSLLLTTPVLADGKDRYRHDSHDRFAGARYERDHHRDSWKSNRHRDYRFESRRHDDRRVYHWRGYREGYSDGYRYRKYSHSRPYYWRDSRHHTHVFYRGDDDWYKWLAGTYLIGELIHHYHDSRICYDHH